MKHVANGDYEMVGTFNGNPLAMTAARAMLCEVATDEAYQKIESLRRRATEGAEQATARHGLAARVVSIGGVFVPPWGKSEQWLLSVQHTSADIDRLNANVSRFAASIADVGPVVS